MRLWYPFDVVCGFLTFGLIGFTVEISVPSALCLLESNTFLRFDAAFWQMGTCFFCNVEQGGRVSSDNRVSKLIDE